MNSRQKLVNMVFQVLHSAGKEAVIEYFKNYVPDIEKNTLQKLSAWKKSGTYPMGVVDAVMDQEPLQVQTRGEGSDDPTEDPDGDVDEVQPTRRVSRVVGNQRRPKQESDPEVTREFVVDQETEERLPQNMIAADGGMEGYVIRDRRTGMPASIGVQNQEPIVEGRDNDIQVREHPGGRPARRRVVVPEGVDPDAFQAAVHDQVASLLEAMGFPSNGIVAPPTPSKSPTIQRGHRRTGPTVTSLAQMGNKNVVRRSALWNLNGKQLEALGEQQKAHRAKKSGE